MGIMTPGRSWPTAPGLVISFSTARIPCVDIYLISRYVDVVTDLAGPGAEHDVAPVGLHAAVPPPDVVCHVPPAVGRGIVIVNSETLFRDNELKCVEKC